MLPFINEKSLSEIVLVSIILFIGSFLYLYKLNDIPPGLALDEVTSGYNAYSLSQTGKDEYGKSFPFSFRFSGTYSPPLYTYATALMITLFGLNIVSVRLISVFAGIGSIIIVFIFLKKMNLLKNKKSAYMGVGIFTILPWVVIYARSGYEAMLPFSLYSLSALLIWIGFKKPIFLSIGLFLLSFSVYASYASRFLSPIFIIGFIAFFRETLLDKKHLKYLLIGLIVAFLVQIPNFSILFTKSFFVKSKLSFGDNLLSQYQEINPFIPQFLAIPYLFLREFLSQYLTYFSFRSLFWDPDPLTFRSIPGLSVFYPWMIIPYVVGLFVAWSNRIKLNYKYLLFLTIVSPIPAAFANDPFWTYRSIPLLLPLISIVTIGIDTILSKKIPFIKLIGAFIFFISLVLLWQGYFVLLPIERAADWKYGYSRLAEEIKSYGSEHFVVDNSRNSLTYLELAFFLHLPPEKLQNAVNPEIRTDYYNNVIFNPDYSFANIETRSINWENDIYKDQTLIGDSLTFSEKQVKEHVLNKSFEIKGPLGNTLFLGYKTNPTKKCLKVKPSNQPLSQFCKQLLKV